MQPGRLNVEVHPWGTVLVVEGELDMADAPAIEQAIASASDDPAVLIVDLTKCDYVDSSILSVLVRQKKRLGVLMRVVAPPACPPRRLVDIAGLTNFLGVLESVAQARWIPAAGTPNQSP